MKPRLPVNFYRSQFDLHALSRQPKSRPPNSLLKFVKYLAMLLLLMCAYVYFVFKINYELYLIAFGGPDAGTVIME